MNTRIGAVVAVVTMLIPAVLLLSVKPEAPLIDQTLTDKESAPIVIVGVILSDTLVRDHIPSHWTKVPLQLRKFTVRVENILRGDAIPDTATVYYFAWTDNRSFERFGWADGHFFGRWPLGLWSVGVRKLFWLRRDSGVLRTACDASDSCTLFVLSGAHPRYKPNLQQPLEYAVVDLLLTRGEGTVDEIEFASSIWWVPDQGLQHYVVEKLKGLALTEDGFVKTSACQQLWTYSVERMDSSLRRDAENSLHDANCRCPTKADGSVQCH